MKSDPSTGTKDIAYLAVVGLVIPLLVMVLAVLTTAFLLARRNRIQREVKEIERRKTLAREEMELQGVGRMANEDKELGNRRDGVVGKKMYLIEIPGPPHSP